MKRILTFPMLCVVLAACETMGQTSDTVSNKADAAYDEASRNAQIASEQAQVWGAEGYAYVDSAMTEAGQHAKNLDEATKDGSYQAMDHIADWLRPSKPKAPLPIAATYCYHVYQDILCYRRPMPGWENRLAGYQPKNAPSPAAAVMEPLPQRAFNAKELPANRVANSKPVFNEMPKNAEPEKPAEDQAVPANPAAEAAHEQLPDPALAPQL